MVISNDDIDPSLASSLDGFVTAYAAVYRCDDKIDVARDGIPWTASGVTAVSFGQAIGDVVFDTRY